MPPSHGPDLSAPLTGVCDPQPITLPGDVQVFSPAAKRREA
jgi:hypothetical protein